MSGNYDHFFLFSASSSVFVSLSSKSFFREVFWTYVFICQLDIFNSCPIGILNPYMSKTQVIISTSTSLMPPIFPTLNSDTSLHPVS